MLSIGKPGEAFRFIGFGGAAWILRDSGGGARRRGRRRRRRRSSLRQADFEVGPA